MKDLTVRTLGAGDAAPWQALRLEALQLYPQNFLVTHSEQVARSLEAVGETLARGFSRGAFQGETLVAIAALVPFSRAAQMHRMELGAFYVAHACQGRGIGRFLAEALIAEARAGGALQLELDVATSNVAAIALYESLGFERVGLIPRATLVNGVAVDDHSYVLFLDA